MSNLQRADLYQPIESARPGRPPLFLRVVVQPDTAMVVGGVPMGVPKIENYILLSALPEELAARVRLAIQALSTSV